MYTARMNWLKKRHGRLVPPGLEITILRKLPLMTFVGTLLIVSLAFYLLVRKGTSRLGKSQQRHQGEMIEWVHLENATWAEVPHRFEAGTPNVAAAAAFPAALDLVEELGAEEEGLLDLEGAVDITKEVRRGPMVLLPDQRDERGVLLDRATLPFRHECTLPGEVVQPLPADPDRTLQFLVVGA